MEGAPLQYTFAGFEEEYHVERGVFQLCVKPRKRVDAQVAEGTARMAEEGNEHLFSPVILQIDGPCEYIR